jgi:hypothetical protein
MTPQKMQRAPRKPLSGQGLALTVPPPPPGIVYRWFNDGVPGRVDAAKAAWWDPVIDPNKKVSVGETKDGNISLGSTVTAPNGQGENLVLMQISRELWEEDLAEKKRHNDAIMNTIRNPPPKDGLSFNNHEVRYG